MVRGVRSTTSYRLGIAVALGTVLLLFIGVGALGVIGAGGEADKVYLAVPAVLVVGSLVARLRVHGMAVALLATAVTQVLAPVVAFAAGLEGTEAASVVDVLGLTAMFSGLFLLSAWFFQRSSHPRAGDGRGLAA
jgi:hypothetical protein